jgi:hypothetical protein
VVVVMMMMMMMMVSNEYLVKRSRRANSRGGQIHSSGTAK